MLAVRQVDLEGASLEDGAVHKQIASAGAAVRALMEASSPYVVRHHGMRVLELDESVRVELFTEYVRGGSLASVLAKCNTLRLAIARDYCNELLIALAALHFRHIVVQGAIMAREARLLCGCSRPFLPLILGDSHRCR